VPFELAWDDAPLDLSFLYESERPAGKHGFLAARSGRFAFEDGTEARFWGTSLNSGASFPTHDGARAVARRLGKFGVNIVRCHQMDADWSTPNLFQFNRARAKSHTRTLDPDSLERFDFLIGCLADEGIYVYLDMITYRRFRSSDGVAAAAAMPEAGKPYVYFDRTLIELQKEFNEQLWSHVNPYRGLAYRDDPAIALTGLLNECDLFSQPAVLEPYRSDLERRYRAWAAEHDVSVPAGDVDFAEPDAAMARFFASVHDGYYSELVGHLRGIGVRVPICGANWRHHLGLCEGQDATDFHDTHSYWDLPHWVTPPRPMVKQELNAFGHGALARTLDKPLFISEWGHAWPQEWRAESALAYAAVAGLQGWGGLAHQGYRYDDHGPVDRIGGGASTLNGRVYRNQLEAFNDPAQFGLFYQAALMFRRGDVRPAEQTVLVEVADAPDWRLEPIAPRTVGSDELPAFARSVETHRVALALPGSSQPAHRRIALGERFGEPGEEIRSDTGELGRDPGRGVGWIDTPRAKAAYGFLGDAAAVELSGCELDIRTDFATVGLASLTDAPIRDSACLLLTAVGRCDNTGTSYTPDRGQTLSFGTAPVLIEAVTGRVRFETTRRDLGVWVIGTHGEPVVSPETTHRDGWLEFEIGPQDPLSQSSIYYLIRP
jgi:hypothetical protein